MKLSFSNIAWDKEEDASIATILAGQGYDCIDVAPGKYFPDLLSVSQQEISAVRQFWAERGFSISGMQSLLFGTKGFNLFGEVGVRRSMLEYLEKVCALADGLGACYLVFGSPKNRDRTGVDDEAVDEVAVDFFRSLGKAAVDRGVVICLEPNPVRYGANFMVDWESTSRIVRLVDHPGIKMQLDTGAIFINGEHLEPLLQRDASLIGHIHLSEAGLVPPGDGAVDFTAMVKLIDRFVPDRTAAIEMIATNPEPHALSVARVAVTIRKCVTVAARNGAW